MSILSWDALSEENPLIAKAQASLSNLDTTAAEAELQEQADFHAQQKHLAAIGATSPAIPPVQNTKLSPANIDIQALATLEGPLGRAAAAVQGYNQQMEFGERIKAVDKRLINSKTDLNQLIPFKYTWAWSMYLDSTEAHWMPTEADGYMADTKQWPALLTSQKKLVYRLVVNYMYSQYLYSPLMLVNLYRLSTNPEMRQYILRQSFEEQAFHHSMRHIVETFDLVTDDIRTLHADEMTFRDRNRALAPYVAKLNDMQTSTASPEEIGDFLVALAVIYGGMRTMYHMVPFYQLWKFNRQTGNLSGVAQNLDWILRDMHRQWDCGIRYMTGIINENPGVMTNDVKERIRAALKPLHVANGDFLSTIIVDETDIIEGEHCSKWFMNHLLNTLGIATDPLKPNPEAEAFVVHFNSLNSKDHGTAEVSLGKSSAGGSLDWD